MKINVDFCDLGIGIGTASTCAACVPCVAEQKRANCAEIRAPAASALHVSSLSFPASLGTLHMTHTLSAEI